MPELSSQGVQIIAPPMWALLELELDRDQRIFPSRYADAAKAAGLDIITWTLERSGLLRDAAGPPPTYYYQSIAAAIDNEATCTRCSTFWRATSVFWASFRTGPRR